MNSVNAVKDEETGQHQETVDIIKQSEISVSHTLDLFFWVTKTMLLSLVHCAYCERFYISVEEAECACIQLIKNINCPKSHKYLCKAVIRINRSFSKMTACGLFYIDASLAICFFGAVTNYAIVMLQFTFL
nr:uncharacterized protein LOC110374951 [Helicoverpa armigera]